MMRFTERRGRLAHTFCYVLFGMQEGKTSVTMSQRRRVIQDWTRVERFEVDDAEYRSFEYHVVEDTQFERTILTIKLFRDDNLTIRLDPSIVAAGEDPATYNACAERRVKHLYANGMI